MTDQHIQQEPNGILLVDKPAGITSHDVVWRVRRLFGTKKVGHTGTLDPLATGVLVVLLGRAAKACEYVSRHISGHNRRPAGKEKGLHSLAR